jgi:glycine/D-amino acid oxidase-like deaminating enzyme
VLTKAPLPFETVGALRFRDQAQFNPASYLIGLGAALESLGAGIFENTPVTSVDAGTRWQVNAASSMSSTS